MICLEKLLEEKDKENQLLKEEMGIKIHSLEEEVASRNEIIEENNNRIHSLEEEVESKNKIIEELTNKNSVLLEEKNEMTKSHDEKMNINKSLNDMSDQIKFLQQNFIDFIKTNTEEKDKQIQMLINYLINVPQPAAVNADIDSQNNNVITSRTGTYTIPNGYTGWNRFSVNVNNYTPSTITTNGTYTIPNGYTGFNNFTVNVIPVYDLSKFRVTKNTDNSQSRTLTWQKVTTRETLKIHNKYTVLILRTRPTEENHFEILVYDHCHPNSSDYCSRTIWVNDLITFVEPFELSSPSTDSVIGFTVRYENQIKLWYEWGRAKSNKLWSNYVASNYCSGTVNIDMTVPNYN